MSNSARPRLETVPHYWGTHALHPKGAQAKANYARMRTEHWAEGCTGRHCGFSVYPHPRHRMSR